MMMMCGAFAAKAQQDSVKHYQKIEQLFAAVNMEEACLVAANATADQTVSNTPQLAGKKDEVRAFFTKYMGYPARKNDLLQLYAKYYTIEEIEVLTAFYKTSAGKKQSTAAVKLQEESVTMLNNALQAHAEELNKLAAPGDKSSSAQ